MTPADIDRVFGRGRLRMLTGAHVEVFREAAAAGERRRYTKRFLATEAGDFRHWTEREWRILARLVGHGIAAVPEVVRFERGSAEQPALVQTYDAGITLDHWATLLPVRRGDGEPALRHVFEDCAHWWALAHHCIVALDAIHALQLVHLDLKADNVCIPFGPADFDPYAAGQRLAPRFEQLALIDFAFSLVSREPLERALPIARQGDFDYQSPRLLHALEAGVHGNLMPTRQLDWRCDLYSLAAMLRRCLPDPEHAPRNGWTALRQTQARALVRRLLEAHDAAATALRPHRALLALTGSVLDDAALVESLAQGWTLAGERERAGAGSPTPVTRIAPALGAVAAVGADTAGVALPRSVQHEALARLDARRQVRRRARHWGALAASVAAVAIAAPLGYHGWRAPAPAPEPVAETSAETSAAGVEPAPAPGSAQPQTAPAAAEAARQSSGGNPPAAGGGTAAAASAAATAARPQVAAQAADPAAASPVPAPVVQPSVPGSPQARDAAAITAAARSVPPHPSARAARSPAPTAQPAQVPAPMAQPARRVATRAPEPRAAKVGAAPARPPARPAAVASERQRALAWLTLRGPSPRGSAMPAAQAPPAALPAPAASAPVSTPAPAPAVRLATAPPAAPVMPAEPAAAPAAIVAPAPPAAVPRAAPVEPAAPDFAARAEQLLALELPTLAQRLERRVQRVMSLAAAAAFAGQDDEVRRAADALDDGSAERLPAAAPARDDAQALHQAARQAFWRRGNAREAHALQVQAFGADPLDGDVAATLAFLALKQGPGQAESARQLALYSLTLPGDRSPATRLADWTTLAIASALAGRERDARQAWFVSLALAPQPERQCRAAINAYALHGEPLRLTVEAMLYRAHASGRAQGSALCEWPPHWVASGPWR